ncbi:hypothetical protein GQS52_16110 [Streptomyces sp. SCUT-3]|nr:hypothetical protein [Streptomyces sp. SCUT-3]QMV23046.1 hypothetical protein GQS52_16110 [Streptomyces sp. SCUT-3]
MTLPENVLRFAPALVTSAVAVLLWAGVRSARGASRAGREVPEQAQGA